MSLESKLVNDIIAERGHGTGDGLHDYQTAVNYLNAHGWIREPATGVGAGLAPLQEMWENAEHGRIYPGDTVILRAYSGLMFNVYVAEEYAAECDDNRRVMSVRPWASNAERLETLLDLYDLDSLSNRGRAEFAAQLAKDGVRPPGGRNG